MAAMHTLQAHLDGEGMWDAWGALSLLQGQDNSHREAGKRGKSRVGPGRLPEA